jgi:hypothetical protein
VLPASAETISGRLADDDLVLDVGGWAKPFARADWVLDLMPYETRGIYGERQAGERFTKSTWVERDMCARDPWPFDDGQFAFAVCSHTLEDVRDPVWVCSELARVARAGYVEVPSRVEEQSWGVGGEWVGWSHHHWLCDVADDEITFVLKPHVLHGQPRYYLEAPLVTALTAEERVQTHFWEGQLAARERIFFEHEEFDEYLTAVPETWRDELRSRLPRRRRGLRGR